MLVCLVGFQHIQQQFHVYCGFVRVNNVYADVYVYTTDLARLPICVIQLKQIQIQTQNLMPRWTATEDSNSVRRR